MEGRAMMTDQKEGLGMVARVGKKEKQQSLKVVSLLELEIPALTSLEDGSSQARRPGQ